MNEVEERAQAQLSIIEQVYSIKIQNRDEIAHFIAEAVDDKRQVLMICTFLNSWIASNRIKDNITIPLHVVSNILKK